MTAAATSVGCPRPHGADVSAAEADLRPDAQILPDRSRSPGRRSGCPPLPAAGRRRLRLPAATSTSLPGAIQVSSSSASTPPKRCSSSRATGSAVAPSSGGRSPSELDARGLFALDDGFDHAVFSYALSMMDDPVAAIDRALDQLVPGGRLHVVDFGDMAGLSAPARPAHARLAPAVRCPSSSRRPCDARLIGDRGCGRLETRHPARWLRLAPAVHEVGLIGLFSRPVRHGACIPRAPALRWREATDERKSVPHGRR